MELFGDLKRHVMGPRLAEPVNEIAGDDVTPIPLESAQPPHAGHVPDREPVGRRLDRSLHARRPRHHAGGGHSRTRQRRSDDTSEARFARANYLNRSTADKRALIAFLENLVLFKVEEEEAAAAASASNLLGLMAPSGPRQVVKIAPKGYRIVVQ